MNEPDCGEFSPYVGVSGNRARGDAFHRLHPVQPRKSIFRTLYTVDDSLLPFWREDIDFFYSPLLSLSVDLRRFVHVVLLCMRPLGDEASCFFPPVKES